MSKEYQGWTSYETWCVNLWIDNEQGSHLFWREQAEEALENAQACATFTRAERATLGLAKALEHHFDEGRADLLDGAKAASSVWADLLNAALSEVNWREIAESMIDNAVETLEAKV